MEWSIARQSRAEQSRVEQGMRLAQIQNFLNISSKGANTYRNLNAAARASNTTLEEDHNTKTRQTRSHI